jgi:hypothetical protein
MRNEKINYVYSPINILGDQITKNRMGGTCSTHGILQRGYGVLVGQPREKAQFEELGLDWRIILKKP